MNSRRDGELRSEGGAGWDGVGRGGAVKTDGELSSDPSSIPLV